MKTIYLISCVSKKVDHKAKARDLYTSPLFAKSLAYAERQKPDAIYVLSAKYRLVPLEKEICPYNVTLNEMKAAERKAWAEEVLAELKKEGADLEKDTFVFLAGKKYRQYLLPQLAHAEVPMEGIGGIGKQLHWLDNN